MAVHINALYIEIEIKNENGRLVVFNIDKNERRDKSEIKFGVCSFVYE